MSIKIYKSYVVGHISGECFGSLFAGYEQEQMALRRSVMEAELALNSFERDTANVKWFLQIDHADDKRVY